MQHENAIDSLELESENYTCVSFETLDLTFPSTEPSSDFVVRQKSSLPLRGRSLSELQKLLGHPLFQEEA